ncbi:MULTISPECIES: PhnD/SsuA/transferrin family substrate-binding protein [Rhodomicrobium]|uniref:PhnD/SsuA/transferrin family substrate-binding protein n=1 Tax=Rhodomicrobium TaxID=1068 RepID=UPI001FD9D2F5|nr:MULTISPECIES: PhnD/SsuA/transferrin family substrate-binding protein [Rhodomicrobium]
MAPAAMRYIASLPMYDWPERCGEVDAEWAAIRDRLRACGVDAPEHLTRRNGDMPAVPDGIRDALGAVIASDPAALPADDLHLHTLWRHPALLFGQTCWGPMELGLQPHVAVIGLPDYSGIEGGEGSLYSSAIVMRRSDARARADCRSPEDGRAMVPLGSWRGARFAFNGPDSMSGYIGLKRDVERAGNSLSLFAGTLETGSHRTSIRAVAGGAADVAAIDARSWHLARRFEPSAQTLAVVGWTSRRQGLPFITAPRLARLFTPSRPILFNNEPPLI